jgi:single-strand DNA-binding protein
MSSEIHILGNLGADAELRFLQNGDPVTSFSICSNEYSRNGETQSWYNVSLFNNSQDIAQYLTKGTGLYLKGRLKPNMWPGRDGNMRLSMNVSTNKIEFTGGKRSGTQTAASTEVPSVPAEVSDAPPSDLSEDDIPF